ncbi:hypothetical protein J3458_020311 [Metarhizium acridum]|uniref:uncharacterized protein n=1 Tax=Metarhizium acridum TaxID=92637 RepID=UPI001C6AB0B3|nr:hypothetical protein J3458_020311 [Metarhizium acridum]
MSGVQMHQVIRAALAQTNSFLVKSRSKNGMKRQEGWRAPVLRVCCSSQRCRLSCFEIIPSKNYVQYIKDHHLDTDQTAAAFASASTVSLPPSAYSVLRVDLASWLQRRRRRQRQRQPTPTGVNWCVHRESIHVQPSLVGGVRLPTSRIKNHPPLGTVDKDWLFASNTTSLVLSNLSGLGLSAPGLDGFCD